MFNNQVFDFPVVSDNNKPMSKTVTELAEWTILVLENGFSDPRDALTEISAKFAEWKEQVQKEAVQEYLKQNLVRPKELDC